MKSALSYLLLLGLAACVNGELLQTLRLLQSSDIFKYLTAEEQVVTSCSLDVNSISGWGYGEKNE